MEEKNSAFSLCYLSFPATETNISLFCDLRGLLLFCQQPTQWKSYCRNYRLLQRKGQHTRAEQHTVC